MSPVEFYERHRARVLADPPNDTASLPAWQAALQELDRCILLLKIEAVRELQVAMSESELVH